jgi:CRISPR-associated endoribonuclease Cas6
VRFEFFRLRFHFEALEPAWFPPASSANIVRGAFGSVLRKLACAPLCAEAAHQPGCVYARIFEPKASDRRGPSGLADWPRPFIFRTGHLDESRIRTGEPFHFDVHLFDVANPALAYFVRALEQLSTDGLGPRRARARLASVEQLALDGAVLRRVFDGETLADALAPTAIELAPHGEPVHAARVRFVTPTELKARDNLAERPEFPILFARIRDRLSTLRALYGPGPLPIDFRGLGDRAHEIKMIRCQIGSEHAWRRSSRTGQVHPLGGFTGEAEYSGELAEFLPYLQAARWTGVGRQTVWGKGEIQLVE